MSINYALQHLRILSSKQQINDSHVLQTAGRRVSLFVPVNV